MYACVQVLLCIHVCTCSVEVTVILLWTSFLGCHPTFLLGQRVSIGLKLVDLTRIAGSQAQMSTCLLHQGWHYKHVPLHSVFYRNSRDWNCVLKLTMQKYYRLRHFFTLLCLPICNSTDHQVNYKYSFHFKLLTEMEKVFMVGTWRPITSKF